jgi:Zn-dependent protease
MIKPAFVNPGDQPNVIGHVFGAPVVVKGITWLPVLELVAAWGLSQVASRKHPDWTRSTWRWVGALSSITLFASEWCHNLAHAAAARLVGKPVDAIRIVWGTPLLVYYDINDQQVSPRQHIVRASGGPVFNALMVPILWLARRFARQGSLAHHMINFALGTNCFLATASLLPIPGIDGGPILKWTLVEHGCSVDRADEAVKKGNLALGSGLAVASGMAFKRRKVWLGIAIAAFAATCLAIGVGWLREQEKPAVGEISRTDRLCAVTRTRRDSFKNA